MRKINLLKKIAGYRGVKKRAGFTLIEVIVAMGIFFIVLIAFLVSYYSYYRNVQYERYKTIGENLAQLQLEDIQNLSVSVLRIIVGENSADGYGYYTDNYIDKNSILYIFNSGDPPDLIDGTFRIYSLTDDSDLDTDPIPGVRSISDGSGGYTLELYNLYPKYKKRIIIEDLTPITPIEDFDKKIFKITVTVYWGDNYDKSVTVEGLKSDIT
jgi:prepilin-type N-terminal cleavage/methylation domain-containing protein